jgi:hypothetical protein
VRGDSSSSATVLHAIAEMSLTQRMAAARRHVTKQKTAALLKSEAFVSNNSNTHAATITTGTK